MFLDPLIEYRRIFIRTRLHELHLISRSVAAYSYVFVTCDLSRYDIVQKIKRPHALDNAKTASEKTLGELLACHFLELFAECKKRYHCSAALCRDSRKSVIDARLQLAVPHLSKSLIGVDRLDLIHVLPCYIREINNEVVLLFFAELRLLLRKDETSDLMKEDLLIEW